MLQRYIRPLCFLLFLAGVVGFALATGRGCDVVDQTFLERFAGFAGGAPVKAGVLLLFGLPLAGVFLLLPEQVLTAFSTAYFGPWAGIPLAACQILAEAFFAFAVARVLLRPDLRSLLLMPGGKDRFRHLAWTQNLSAEACFTLESLLLLCPFLPAALAGFVLGLTGMRPKAFGIGAVPWLFLRAAVAGTATVHLSGPLAAFLASAGTLLFLIFLWCLAQLFKKRMHKDAMASSQRIPARRPAREAQPPDQAKLAAHRIVEDLNRPDVDDSLAMEASLPVEGAMVVCVEDAGCMDPDVARLIEAEAGRMGVAFASCTLAPRPDRPGIPVKPGFGDRDRVSDLDEVFAKAFGAGYGTVIAVRASTPLVRESMLRRALLRLSRSSLVLGPTSGGYYLVGLRREAREGQGNLRRYESALLAGRTFESDLSFALAGFCRRPETLPLLPGARDLTKPLVSVVVPAEGEAEAVVRTVASACQGPWTECFVADPGEGTDTAALASQAGAEVVSVRGDEAVRLNEVAHMARGQILLFAAPGTVLPRGYEAMAWETLQQEGCRVGCFSLPSAVSPMRRAMLWAGTALFRTGALGLPGMNQGIFFTREDFRTLQGFSAKAGEGRAVQEFVSRLQSLGRMVIHNARVEIPGMDAAGSGRGLAEMLESAAGSARRILAPALGARRPGETGEAPAGDLEGEARSLLEPCDHCGRCTEACPMLKRHGIDLTGLADAPLLAWSCFLCGQCTRACPAGIDGARLAHLLREQYVQAHNGRMARPGHGRTIAASRHAPVVLSQSKPGPNLLLDQDFCSSFPETALALAAFALEGGMGVVVADAGSRLAMLGMAAQARASLQRLREALAACRAGVLYTVSPATHAHLEQAGGFDVRPVYDLLAERGLPARVDGSRFALFTPCMDRDHEIFAKGFAGFLASQPLRIDDVPCCGAGGEASVAEPEVAAQMKARIRACPKPVATTCTGCAVSLALAGCRVSHALSLILQTPEAPLSGMGAAKAYVAFLLRLRNIGKEETPVLRPAAAPLGAAMAGQQAPQGGLDINIDIDEAMPDLAGLPAEPASPNAAPEGVAAGGLDIDFDGPELGASEADAGQSTG
ncbi:MAG: DUF2064 domain-containing protein, partial [Desulfovibrio sp.]|nr:DUF2064 domain-containing protein [Desulfovibrio sp.]